MSGKYYDAELDFQSKMVDMREDWDRKQAEKAKKELLGAHIDDDDEYSDEVNDYFHADSKHGSDEERVQREGISSF